MKEENESVKPIQFIRDLCKAKSEKEILEAEENFREYLLAVKEICDRLEAKNVSPNFDDV
jgi:hypothetical protein